MKEEMAPAIGDDGRQRWLDRVLDRDDPTTIRATLGGAMTVDRLLRETPYCNFSHPSISRVAALFRASRLSDRDLATSLFTYVRDGIRYQVGGWQQTAAQTLARGTGTCTNSANLLVALLRGAGIRAAYGVMTVRGREYFGPIAPPRLARMASGTSKHVYVYVWLGTSVLRCDPSDDAALATGSHHLNPQSTLVTWSGDHDAMLNLNPDHVLADDGPLDDIDAMIGRPMRRSLVLPVRIANCYIEFLRQEGGRLTNVAQAHESFDQWLRLRNPLYWQVYRALPSGSLSRPARSGRRNV